MSSESSSSAAVARGLRHDLAIWRLRTDGEDLARHAHASMADQLSASRR